MVGKTLSHYEVLASIGVGGMGEVYLAEDTKLKRKVALKVLPAELASDPQRIARFQREAEAVAALNHPNIVHIYSVDEAEGLHFLTMELIEGKQLDRLIPDSGLGVDEFFDIAIPLTSALAAAHVKGITHRDLKPSNIMIAAEDRRVKILDFGLAKLAPFAADDPDATQMATVDMTQEGTLLGTVPYMSPEQLEAKPTDCRTDIFSLGIVLYEMATGSAPFVAENRARLISSILTEAPASVTEVRRDLPAPLGRIIRRCLEKDPADRYQTARDVQYELKQTRHDLESGSVNVSAAATETRAVPTKRPRSLVLAVAAVTSVVLLVILSPWILSVLPSDSDSDPAGPSAGAPPSRAAEAELPDDDFQAVVEARSLLDHYYREGNVDGAIRLFEHALALNPDNATAYAGLAQAFVWKNLSDPDALWLDRALEAASSALQRADQLAASHLAMGIVLRERGETDAALEQLRRALELDPLSAAAHRELGVTLAAGGETDAALDAYDEAIGLDPEDWLGFQRLGQLQYQQTRFDDAVDSFRRALELAPDYVSAHRNLGAVYHMLGRYEEAAAELQRSLEIEPTDRTYSNLGTLQFFLGRYGAAVDSFEKAIELGANDYFYWGNLGDAYRWAPGRRGEAAGAYERALELGRELLGRTPDDVFLRAELALYEAKRGNTDRAISEIEQVLPVAESDPWILNMAAVIFELGSRRDDALDALGSAVEAGYSIEELKRDPELIELRKDPAYHRLMQTFENRQTES